MSRIQGSRGIPYSLSLTVFLLYLRSASPEVGFQDSGEFVSCAASLGVAHPSGYPLWCLMGGLIKVVLPFGSVAFRVSVLSALLAAVAAGVGASMAAQMMPSTWTPFAKWGGVVVATGVWCTGLATWSQSAIAEVYALNALLLILALSSLYAWSRSPCPHRLLQTAFWLGMALSNHHTTGVFLPFMAWLIIAKQRGVGDPRQGARLIALVVLGFAVHIYLPLRASAGPPNNWGAPVTGSTFFWHITRSQFGPYSFSRSGWILLHQLKAFGQSLIAESGWPFILLGAMGVIGWMWNREKRSVHMAILFIGSGILAVFLLNYDLTEEAVRMASVFFIPWHLIVALMASSGIAGLLMTVGRVSPMAPAVLLLIMSLLPIRGILSRLAICATRHDAFAEEYGRAALRSLDRASFLFLRGEDTAFVVHYLRDICGYRQDLLLLQRPAILYQMGYVRDLVKTLEPMQAEYPESLTLARTLASQWQGQGQIKATVPDEVRTQRDQLIDAIILEGLQRRAGYWDVAGDEVRLFPQMLPEGLFFRIVPQGIRPSDWSQVVRSSPRSYPELARAERDPLFFVNLDALRHYASHFRNVGAFLATQAGTASERLEAITFSRYALNLVPDMALAKANLGTYLMGLGRQDEAISLWREAIADDPGCLVAYDNLTTFLLRANRMEEAIATCERRLSLDVRSIETRLILAQCYAGKDWTLRASEQLGIASGLADKNAPSTDAIGMTQLNIAKAFLAKGDLFAQNADSFLAQASDSFSKAIGLDEQRPEWHEHLAETHFWRGLYQESVSQFNEALTLMSAQDPRTAEIHANLGSCYAKLGAKDEAMESFLRSVTLAPRLAMTRYNLGTLYLENGALDQAEKELRRAIELDPNYGMAYHTLGLCLEKKGQWAEAKDAYSRALDKMGSHVPSMINLGICWFHLGDYRQSRSTWKKVLDLDPGSSTAAKYLASLDEVERVQPGP